MRIRADILVMSFFLILVVLAVSVSAYKMHSNIVPPLSLTASSSSQTTYWESRIRAVGPGNAYKEFASWVRDADPGTQHSEAHVFGGALYETEGLPGISTCDSRFSSGCFHEFLGRAIAEQGLSVVTQLGTYCVGKGGCGHGIGHGLVSYLGYTPSDLTRSIDICTALPQGDFLDGCLGGSFMEYNMRTMLQADNGAVRPATSTNDLLDPCDHYSGAPERACLLYQPQWWWVSSDSPLSSSGFARMGRLCDEVSGDDRTVCFIGIGEMAPPLALYDIEQSVQLCKDATSDPSTYAYCVAGDALAFHGIVGASAANKACATLTGSVESMCDAYSEDSALIDQL